jgi:hypothetical protein
MKILITRLWKPNVETGCCIYNNHFILELNEFEKNKKLINNWFSLAQKNYILENQNQPILTKKWKLPDIAHDLLWNIWAF